MIILHVIDVSKTECNGVVTAVKSYLEYEKKYATVALLCLDKRIDVDGVETFIYSKSDNKGMLDKLPALFSKPDLVIFNEVYKPRYIKLYKECLRKNIKYVVIPHGCLVDVAQKKHYLKKTLGNILLFNRFLENANAIQFLNNYELKNTHKKFKKVIIDGNGIELPKTKNNWTSNNANCKKIVYIGRYSVIHKGLDLVVEVCKKYKKWFQDNNVVIELYGIDADNGYSYLEKEIQKYKLQKVLKLNFAIYGQEKECVLLKAYGFIQCSRFEGQPMGIIEAMMFGVPCIVTNGTYMGNFIADTCGYVCDFDKDSVFSAISQLCNDEQKRLDFSKNASKVANKNFYIDNVIRQTLSDYLDI